MRRAGTGVGSNRTRVVAIYARVSMAEQSPEAQLTALREYAGVLQILRRHPA